MKTKLTLSIEKEVIEEARALLKEEGKNLSKTIEAYLRKLIADKRKEQPYPEAEDELLPEVRELIGIFKTDKPIDPDQARWEYLRDKYGLDD